jgi:hypothetical protein
MQESLSEGDRFIYGTLSFLVFLIALFGYGMVSHFRERRLIERDARRGRQVRR